MKRLAIIIVVLSIGYIVYSRVDAILIHRQSSVAIAVPESAPTQSIPTPIPTPSATETIPPEDEPHTWVEPWGGTTRTAGPSDDPLIYQKEARASRLASLINPSDTPHDAFVKIWTSEDTGEQYQDCGLISIVGVDYAARSWLSKPDSPWVHLGVTQSELSQWMKEVCPSL